MKLDTPVGCSRTSAKPGVPEALRALLRTDRDRVGTVRAKRWPNTPRSVSIPAFRSNQRQWRD